ncbi:MAG: helix-turn-helix transcriptional regulator [Betaproteobacteria bacterium]|nr:helix-turn-helix transcriptional regulator [Betaproteobacteria bacterium]
MPRARYSDHRDFYVALGVRIAKARHSRLTQDALAKKVGLTRTSIINIEKGRQQVLVHTLEEIARALNASVTDLMPRRDDVVAALRDKPQKGRDWVLSAAGIEREEN